MNEHSSKFIHVIKVRVYFFVYEREKIQIFLFLLIYSFLTRCPWTDPLDADGEP